MATLPPAWIGLCISTIENQTNHCHSLSATVLLQQEVKKFAADHPMKFQSSSYV